MVYIVPLHEPRSATLTTSSVTRKWNVTEESSGIRCSSDRGWSFLLPPPCRDELTYFTTTPRGQTELQTLAEAAEEGGIFFDVGAHAGVVSAIFCAANPGNKVFSFEPSPLSVERIAEMAGLNHFNNRLNVQRVAIGERDHMAEMLIDPAG